MVGVFAKSQEAKGARNTRTLSASWKERKEEKKKKAQTNKPHAQSAPPSNGGMPCHGTEQEQQGQGPAGHCPEMPPRRHKVKGRRGAARWPRRRGPEGENQQGPGEPPSPGDVHCCIPAPARGPRDKVTARGSPWPLACRWGALPSAGPPSPQATLQPCQPVEGFTRQRPATGCPTRDPQPRHPWRGNCGPALARGSRWGSAAGEMLGAGDEPPPSTKAPAPAPPVAGETPEPIAPGEEGSRPPGQRAAAAPLSPAGAHASVPGPPARATVPQGALRQTAPPHHRRRPPSRRGPPPAQARRGRPSNTGRASHRAGEPRARSAEPRSPPGRWGRGGGSSPGAARPAHKAAQAPPAGRRRPAPQPRQPIGVRPSPPAPPRANRRLAAAPPSRPPDPRPSHRPAPSSACTAPPPRPYLRAGTAR